MTETFEDGGAAVRARCVGCGGDCWRQPDASHADPVRCAKSLTGVGFLAAPILAEFVGSPKAIPWIGRNAAACHALMYTMGAILRHGLPSQKESLSAGIARRKLRLQALAVSAPAKCSNSSRLRVLAVREGEAPQGNGRQVGIPHSLQVRRRGAGGGESVPARAVAGKDDG